MADTRDRPFFSLVVACCDVEPYVRECLDSVLGQPFADWECLIGVETSKDKTEEIVRAYAAKDARFKVFTGPRSGSCSASRNTGIDMAQGEYVIFLDGDDTIADGALKRIHDKIAARPGADLYPCAIRVVEDGTGRETELRDNYSKDAPAELTGVEATLFTTLSPSRPPCPMLQMTVFRRKFLVEHGLKCIVRSEAAGQRVLAARALLRETRCADARAILSLPDKAQRRQLIRSRTRLFPRRLGQDNPLPARLPCDGLPRAMVRPQGREALGTGMAPVGVLLLVRPGERPQHPARAPRRDPGRAL